jgi:hypothetical protein
MQLMIYRQSRPDMQIFQPLAHSVAKLQLFSLSGFTQMTMAAVEESLRNIFEVDVLYKIYKCGIHVTIQLQYDICKTHHYLAAKCDCW